jgi:NAD(P)-dependent dehydrogenase (short-subunit alcohol dehydrogenase family)
MSMVGVGHEIRLSVMLTAAGVFFLTAAFLPLLRKSDSPSVINIASIAGLANQRATGSLMYGVSKVSHALPS